MEPAISVSTKDPLNVVTAWIDYRVQLPLTGYPHIVSAFSRDGGLSWTESFVPQDFGGFHLQGDPSVVCDDEGNFYLVFLAFQSVGAPAGIYVAKSVDYGATWSEELIRRVDREDPDGFDDKPWITIDQGKQKLYVVWSHGLPQRVMISASEDRGNSWEEPREISDQSRPNQFGAMPVIGSDGTVYVAWTATGTDSRMIYFDRSTDGINAFGEDIEVDAVLGYSRGIKYLSRLFTFPFLAINPVDGDLYIAWNNRVSGPVFDSSDVLFTRSVNGGDSWSTPINVVTNALNPSVAVNDQFFPFVAVNPGGNRVSVMFYDRSDFPENDSMYIKVVTSINGGLTFTSPVRITDHPSFPAVPPFYGGFLGDYNGLTAAFNTSTPGVAFVVWTDTRYGNPDIFMSPADIEILLSGSITTNSVLSAKVLIEGNVVVNQGRTLTATGGTTVQALSGKSLTVNGSLVASGTSQSLVVFEKSDGSASPWKGIVAKNLKNSYSADLRLENVVFSGVEKAVHAEMPMYVRMVNVTINDPVFGVEIVPNPIQSPLMTPPTLLQYVWMNNVLSRGIIVNNYSNLHIMDCSILGSTQPEWGLEGISLTAASPNILRTTIKSFNYGVRCLAESHPMFLMSGEFEPSVGCNTLDSNDIALQCEGKSSPVLGWEDPLGNNSFTNSTSYNAVLQEGSEMAAYYNWWGNNPPKEELFLIEAGAALYYEPYLESPPDCGGSMSFVSNKSDDNSSGVGESFTARMHLALQKRIQGQYAEALAVLKSVITDRSEPESNKRWALRQMVAVFHMTSGTNLSGYLSSLVSGYPRLRQVLATMLPSAFLHEGSFEDAMTAYSVNVSNYANTDVEMQALYGKFLLALYTMGDRSMAEATHAQLAARYPGRALTDLAEHQLALATWLSGALPSAGSSTKNANQDSITENATSTYSLKPCYPNPFNPSTELSFELPEPAAVSLNVYDLLGRKVVELANGNYEAGYHSVTWNASDFASGVYLARFNVINRLSNLVYTKTNKLVLMK